MNRTCLVMAATTLAALSCTAQAQDAGDWILRVGVHSVQPDSNNNETVNVDAAESLTFNGTYMFTSRWGLELLAAAPFEHDINLNGGGRVGSTKHLPPTLSVQFHANPNGRARPYFGVGLNYTYFFDEETTGALEGADLELDPSWGLAAQAGIDVSIGEAWFINADVRYMDIETDATVNNASIGTVKIDPYAYGLSVGRRF